MAETSAPFQPVRFRLEAETLDNLLIEADDLRQALTGGLDFLLATLQRQAGAIFTLMDSGAHPTLWVNNLPGYYLEALDYENSGLNRHLNRVLAGQANDYSPEAEPDEVIIPLRWNGKVIGAVLMIGAEPAPGLPEEWEVLMHPLERAIQRYSRHGDISQRPAELAAMKLIVSAQNTDLDINQIQLQMCRGIVEIFQGEAVQLFLLDDDDPLLAIRKTLQKAGEWTAQVSLKLESGLALGCIQTEQPAETLDVYASPFFEPEIDGLEGMDVHNAVCMPMIANGQRLGVLEVLNSRAAPLDRYHRGLLLSMTTALANAIQNRRLLLRLKVINGDLEASRWELLNSRNTLRTLFDSIPSSIYIVDRKYSLIAINLARAARAGQKPNLLVGRRCYEALFNRDHPCSGCRVSETFSGGKSTERIITETLRDDQVLNWQVTTFPIYQESATQPVQVIILEQDVTEKQRLESNLIQSERLAAVGQLAAGVAHEINNPLAAIIANAQLLERDLKGGDEDTLESARLISLAGSRASRVVRTLLSFSRKDKLEFGPVDLNANIMNAISLLQHEIVSRPITLEMDLSPDLPRTVASKDHLEGIWINLIMNAIDATEGQQCKLRISTTFQNNRFRISIADNGSGIDPDHLAHIFEPFYTTKAPGRGTGLGLSVCYRTICQHGGTIEVESKLGQGTKFTVVLPPTPV